MRAVISEYLRENLVKPGLISLFITELNGEPTKAKVTVYLRGITVEDTPIKLSPRCILRRIAIGDIEREVPVSPWGAAGSALNDSPTAILEIEMNVTDTIEMQKEVELAILTLRLFGVGGVAYVSYNMSGRTIFRMVGGTISNNQMLTASGQLLKIYSGDVDRLKHFWKEFQFLDVSALSSFGRSSGLENTHFAYQRYCDALFSVRVFEQQIASAIIGLESLYLNDSEELSRFLRLRVSKFLSLAGLEPYGVQDVLKDAYSVRSFFVHGNKLNYKTLKKIRRKYGSELGFLIKVLDYLRISILFALVINRQKDEFIDWIDDSFIDKQKENELTNELERIMKQFGTSVDT